ncbi:hypothetical protein MPSEU_000303500 [Mayamaea pseudoterrestris]|nr:hypothetical protein MPSEU_000303500 [Mayamaea pseudoterrestris]
MRTLQATTFISIVTTVASLSNEAIPQRKIKLNSKDPNGRRQQQGGEQDLTAATTVLRDSLAIATRKLKRQRTNVIRAPLVDSQLLRFVGAQKGRLQETAAAMSQQIVETEAIMMQQLPSSRRGVTLESDDESDSQNANEMSESFASAVATQQSSLPLDDKLQQSESSFGQFNCHRVALVLQNHGADAALALEVGERVQAHALSRTTRRRIRAFLKERDIVWRSSMVSTVDESPSATLPQLQQELENRILDRISRPNTNAYLESLKPPSDNNNKATIRVHSFKETVDLMLGRGLTIKDVCEILMHSPGIALMRPYVLDSDEGAGETLQETLDRVLYLLLQTLSLRKYDARKVLRVTPSLLTMRGSKQAEQLILVMSQSLGVSTNSLARDKNALSILLSRTPAAMFRFIAFLSSDVVRMPMDKIGPLIRRDECQCVLDKVAPVTEVIMEQSLEQDPCVISALWDRRRASQARRERINEIYKTMSKTAITLRDEIGTDDLGRVIAAYPGVLLLDAETEILPAADYLMKRLGIWEDDLPRVLQSFPALLGLGMDRMRAVPDYLLSLEVSEENLGNILRSFPALLTLSIEKDMEPVVAFLRSTVGISNIGRFVTRLPPVLGYSVERELQPKWDFLLKVAVDAAFEASRFPAYFSYPLERVIKTRYAYLAQVKKLPPSILPLDSVLRYGDKDFAVKVARDQDGGKAFRTFCDERRRVNPNKNKQPAKKPLRLPESKADRNA